MAYNDMNLTRAETRYLRKEVRKILGFRRTNPPRDTNGVVIPKERAEFLRSLAVTFTQKDY
jgi:hypothetical protein